MTASCLCSSYFSILIPLFAIILPLYARVCFSVILSIFRLLAVSIAFSMIVGKCISAWKKKTKISVPTEWWSNRSFTLNKVIAHLIKILFIFDIHSFDLCKLQKKV